MAQWNGARYFRERDHTWVDREDQDKKKNVSAHRLSKTSRGKFTKLEIKTRTLRPLRRRR